jgi:1-acyl-sn-glycerol-3-phosphate acyltransferase
VGALDMFTTGRGLLVSALLLAISACGGLFIVPLYSLLQARPDPSERGQVIAANNLVSSVYIVVSQVALIGLAALGLTPPQIFGVLAFINLLGMIYLYSLIPEFMYRFLAWVLSNILYRLKTEGIENIPQTGGCVLVCNHVSFVDWLIVGGACPRPARFVMDKFMFQIPVANIFVRHAKAIPIASRKIDPEMLERAFDLIAAELEAGNVVCIFPEGGLTRDGDPLEYRAGIEKIIERTPVPVVPLALNGLWGSFFSRVDGAALKTPFRRGLRSPLWVKAGTPIPAEEATVETVRDAILAMWRQRPDDR